MFLARSLRASSPYTTRSAREEVLTKTISKLRKALHDNPKQGLYIETLAKKGYRFNQTPTQKSPAISSALGNKKRLHITATLAIAILFISALAYYVVTHTSQPTPAAPLNPELQKLHQQAEDYYFQYTRLDNENAIKLYERIIAAEPEFGPAQSGLATALVQKVLRWPNELGTPDIEHTTLAKAHDENRLSNSSAQHYLSRAQALAERATRLSPDDSTVHRSLGLVYSAQQKFDLAMQQYDKAIDLNPNAWGAMINKAELYDMKNDSKHYLDWLIKAYHSMTLVYDEQTVKIRPWHNKVALAIARQLIITNNPQEAEKWYNTVLDTAPLNIEANQGLMQLLLLKKDYESYLTICHKVQTSLKPEYDCSLPEASQSP